MKKLLLLIIVIITVAGMALTSCGAFNPTTSPPQNTSSSTTSIDPDIFNPPDETTDTPEDTTNPPATTQVVDQMVLVPLTSGTLAPSDTFQQVSWNNQVTVTVPGGLLTDSQTLTISRVDNAPPDKLEGAVSLGAYDISMGDLKEFDRSLTIEIAYDPTQLAAGMSPDQSIYAEWWDATQGIWWRSVSQVKPESNLVVISTNHLSRWRIEMIYRGDQTVLSNHFIVVWNPNESPKVGGTPQDPKAFATKVSGYLEAAWQKYYDEKYAVNIGSEAELKNWPTDWPNPIELGRVWVTIDKNFTESETGSLSGDITLKFSFDNDDQVKQDTAHELFHNTHLGKAGEYVYVQSHWWADAAADYAATRIAWPNIKGLSNISGDYFQSPLTTCDSIHEYETARFIEYMVRHGYAFTQLFNDMTPHRVVPTPELLDTLVQKIWSKNLLEIYRTFMAAVLFDTAGPLDPIALNPSLLEGLTAPKGAPIGLAADATSLSYTFQVPGGYAAQRWGFKVATTTATPTRTLTVKLSNSTAILPISQTASAIYVLPNDQRVTGGVKPLAVLTPDTQSADITVSNGDVVYIIGVNGTKNTRTWDIEVEDAVKAGPATATMDVSSDFGMQYTEGGKIHVTGTLTIEVQSKGVSVTASHDMGDSFEIRVNKNEPVRVILTYKSTLSQTTERFDFDAGGYKQETYSMPFVTQPFTDRNFNEIGTMTKSEWSATFDFTAPQVDCSSEVNWSPHEVETEYDENGDLEYTEQEQVINLNPTALINIFFKIN